MKSARGLRALAFVFALQAGAASCTVLGNATSAEAAHKIPTIHHSNFQSGKPVHSEVKVDGRTFQVTRAIVNAPAEDVWSVLTNYEEVLTYMPNVKDYKILSTSGDTKKIWFNVTSMSGLWKFEYVLSIAESKPEHRIEWQRDSGAFKVNEGSWTLEPIEKGKHTLVTYAKYVDGGLFMPKTFVNSELKRSMPAIMSNLATAVYKNRKLAQNHH